MGPSLFLQWVAQYMPGVVLRITETQNGTTSPLTYLHKTMLTEQLSVTGKWESLNTANSQVAADVVAMNSALPLKRRDSISKAYGDIPKMGMKLQLNESQLSDLDTLVAQNASNADIVAKLFSDLKRCIVGIDERNEEIFLRGLSTGVVIVDENENVGTGIRLDYGYSSANKFGVAVLWTTAATATPFDDIQRVLDKAALDGNTITSVMLDQTAFNSMAGSKQAKDLFAFSQGFVGATIPTPSLSQINSFVSDRYGFSFQIINRSIRYEKDGTQTSIKPWADGAVVFLTSTQVGQLVYARLAEENHPNKSVTYAKSGSYILTSKYGTVDPVAEFTSSQARVLPVIANVDQIYTLDSKTVQA